MAGRQDAAEQPKGESELAQELNLRLEQQASIATLGRRALAGADLPDLLDDSVRTVAKNLRTDFVELLESVPDSDELLLRDGVGWREGVVGYTLVAGGNRSHAGFTVESNAPVVVEDLASEKRFVAAPHHIEHGIRSGVSVLIRRPGGRFGVLGVHSRERRTFSEHDINYLQAIANVLGEAAARKEAEETQAHLSAIVVSSHDAIFRKTLSGVITSWNAAAQRMYGYTAEEIVGQNVRVLFPPELEHTLEEIMEHVRNGQAYPMRETERVRKDGRRIPISLSVSPVRNRHGEVIAASTIAHDITERKRAEEALRRAHDELEQRVAERTRELEDVVRELESFSYAVSHDLRAPLRSVDGFARVLEEDYGSQLDDSARSYLERIVRGSRRMSALIEDLLNLSRLSHRPLSLRTVDLSAIASRLEGELRERAPERRVDFAIEEGLTAQGDEDLLAIALTNLIENAWKFTRDVAEPRIEFGATRQRSEKVFFVSDNGIGFDMRYSGKLFVPFQRLHSSEVEGTGIGLATVQRIVHRHGGRIWANSKEGEGASFYFTLPGRNKGQG